MTSKSPILVFAYGNPSRGDDALGPKVFDQLEAHQRQHRDLDHVELLTDFQLQVEHAVDLEGRKAVLFVDASHTAKQPFDFMRLHAEQDESYTTHAMKPAAVLEVFQRIMHERHPPAFMLAIRGYAFELGAELSEQAAQNLQAGFEFLKPLLRTAPEHWLNHAEDAGASATMSAYALGSSSGDRQA